MRLIGIAGHARSGKDTIAQWLVRNRDAASVAFAAPIKRAIEGMFFLDRSVWDSCLKEQPLVDVLRSPREMAQTLGTEWGRKLVHPDIWVIITRAEIEALGIRGVPIVVVSDVRFENEANYIRERGTLLHVYRDGADGDVGIKGHESEHGIQFCAGDVLISNNGTIEELYHKLGALFPQAPR